MNYSPEILVETSIIDNGTCAHACRWGSVHDNDMYDYEYQILVELLSPSTTENTRSMEGLGGIIFLRIFTPRTILKKSLHFLAVYGMKYCLPSLIYIGNKISTTDTLKIIVNDLEILDPVEERLMKETTLNVKNVNDHLKFQCRNTSSNEEDTEIILKDIFVTDTDLRYTTTT